MSISETFIRFLSRESYVIQSSGKFKILTAHSSGVMEYNDNGLAII